METQFSLKRTVTRSGDYAISQAEAKLYCKQDLSADDTVFTYLINDVCSRAELVTQKQMNDAETIVLVFEVSEPNSDGHYVLPLSWDDSSIVIDSITAIDIDGDADTIEASDYQVRDNSLWFLTKSLRGYQLTVTLTCTTTSAAMEKYKSGLLEVLAQKYYDRNANTTNGLLNSLSEYISGRNWL